MDIYCSVCGEPTDIWCIGEEAEAMGNTEEAYASVRKAFRKVGCNAFPLTMGEASWCKPNNSDRANIAAALMGLMGDDLDGVASMMEDY